MIKYKTNPFIGNLFKIKTNKKLSPAGGYPIAIGLEGAAILSPFIQNTFKIRRQWRLKVDVLF